MSFRRYATEKIVAAVIVFWLAVSMVFLLFHVVQDDPARSMAGKGASQSTVQRAARDIHADKPLSERYGWFLERVFIHADLGRSYYNREPARTIAAKAAPVTASLVAGALVFALLLGVPLGLVWARRPRTVGPVASPFVYVSMGLMPIWLATILLGDLCFRTGLFPHAGVYCDFFSPSHEYGCDNPGDWALHLVIPSIVVGLPVAALYARLVRSLAVDVSRSNKRAAELLAARLMFAKTILRDACWLFGATMLIELFFDFPGLGGIAHTALTNYDLPTIEADLIFVALVQIGLHLAGDLLGAALSPRWRTI